MSREIYKRVYDSPIDKNGKEKENELLGVFEVVEQIEESDYSEMLIAKRIDDKKGDLYFIEAVELSGRNGGMMYFTKKLKNLKL